MKIVSKVLAASIFLAVASTHASAATASLNGSSKAVWAATVQSLSAHAALKTLDRDSGLIMSEPTTIDAGFNNRQMGAYVTKPRGLGGFLATWNGLRVQITATVTEVDTGHSSISLEARYEGFENNVSHSWVSLPSNGSFEDTLIAEIQRKLP